MKWLTGIVLGLLLLGLASVAGAHNPRAEISDWGNLDSPYVVEDAPVSFAFFGSLADAADSDVFRMDFPTAEDKLRLRLFVPVCGETFTEFTPLMLLLKPTSSNPLETWSELLETEFADFLPDDFAPTEAELVALWGELPANLAYWETYTTASEASPRPIEHETHTDRDYYVTETVDYPIEAVGSYYVAIFSPERGGDYLLSSGYLEEFFRPLPSEPKDVTMGTDWTSGLCD